MSKVILERKTYMPEKHTFLKCFLGFVNVKSHARKKPLLAGYLLMLIVLSQRRNNAIPPPRTILMPMKSKNGYVRKVLVQF